jgi:predicted nucleotidyltransferase
MNHDKQIDQFLHKARAAFGPKLDAILLYGSAARGEFDPHHSDLNLLVLLHSLDRHTLATAAPLLENWLACGHPQPLFFTRAELRSATDAFPIEILDILSSHRLLHGDSPLTGLSVDPALHRAQLEHELRSKLLRLRQKAILVLAQPQPLLRLLADSAPTFLLLLRHQLLLSGENPPAQRRALLDFAHNAGLVNALPFAQLLDLREGKLSPRALDSVQLFEDYLTQIERLVHAADSL